MVRKGRSCEAVYTGLEYGVRLFPRVNQREPSSDVELIDKGSPEGVFDIGLTGPVGKIVYEDRPDVFIDIFTAGAEAVAAT